MKFIKRTYESGHDKKATIRIELNVDPLGDKLQRYVANWQERLSRMVENREDINLRDALVWDAH